MGEGRGMFTHSKQVTARCIFTVLGCPSVLQVSSSLGSVSGRMRSELMLFLLLILSVVNSAAAASKYSYTSQQSGNV